MHKKILSTVVVLGSILGQGQELSTTDQSLAKLATPHRQADFSPVIASGTHDVRWGNGFLVSFPPGEMKEPISLYDRDGKLLFETWPSFDKATKLYTQDAAVNGKGNVVIAASAAAKDGTTADMIVDVNASGARRVIRTTPFYPLRVCVTDAGIVWAYGKELSTDRTTEPRSDYPMLREYSFEKGELRSVLNRNTVVPPSGVPVNGSRNDVYLKCTANSVVLVIGPTTELVRFDLATGNISRSAIPPLPEGAYITGAAVTESGGIYVSTLRPGKDAIAGMMRLRSDTAHPADVISTPKLSSLNQSLFLLGNDGEDLVYSRGRRTPTLFWSNAVDSGATK